MMSLVACVGRDATPIEITTLPERNWPMYQYRASHNAVFMDGHLHAQWTTRLGAQINGGLAIVNGILYADSFNHRLYAIDMRTGRIRWSAVAANILMSTPVISNGIVIVGSGHNGFLKPDDWTSQIWGRPEGDEMMAFSSDAGHLLWKFHTPGEDMPSPAINGTNAIFANGDLHAYAVNLISGKALWQTDLPGKDAMASVTVADGLAFVSTCRIAPRTCETRALDVRTGRTVWAAPYGGSDCSPAVDRGIVFVDGSVWDDSGRYQPGGRDVLAALDEHTGRVLWTRRGQMQPYSIVASAEENIAGTAVGGALYQSISNEDIVVAINGRTGETMWSVSTLGPVKMSPVITSDRVYFGDTAGVLYDVDRVSGRIVATNSFLKPFSVSPPVIVGDTMFVANGDAILAIPLDLI